MECRNGRLRLDRPDLFFQKAETYEEMGLLREAIREYQRALSEESLKCRATRRIANCLIGLKLSPQAEKVLLQSLLSLNAPIRDRLHIYSDLAELYLGQGRVELALERLLQIRTEDENFLPDLSKRIQELMQTTASPVVEFPLTTEPMHVKEVENVGSVKRPNSLTDRSSTTYSDTKRRALRAKISITVDYSFDQDTWATGYSTDLSTSGMFILTYEPIPVGSVVFLRFNLPGCTGEATMEIIGLAVRQDTRLLEIDRVLGMGIQFVSIDEHQENRLKLLVDELLEEEDRVLSLDSRIRFHCDRCGRILTATGSASGKLGKCLCGGKIPVPFLRHTPTPDNPLRGLVLAGCRIDGVMGKGSAATVYRAHHLALDIPVAIKILHPDEKKSHTPMARRFLKEARVIARIKHPNIVAVLNAGEEQGYSFIVMQLVLGGSLSHVLQKEGKVSTNRCIRLALDVCGALKAAHEYGIMHGDVKPANILITSGGTALLVDFGLVRDLKTNRKQKTSGKAMGTPLYIAPEQAMSSPALDARADIYSLGATLYHSLTGTPPFQGSTAKEVLRKHMKEAPVPLKELRLDVPDALSDIVSEAMEKKPEDRFQSAEALTQELLKVCRNKAVEEFRPLRRGRKKAKPRSSV
jgi:tRNA A-37 threonylcarbamoyl transferase component Bud32/tetratricopeptide (TPR) repeat protein